MTAAGSSSVPDGARQRNLLTRQFIARSSARLNFLQSGSSSSSIDNSGGPGNPGEASVEIVASARWESAEEGFVAFHAYDVTIDSD